MLEISLKSRVELRIVQGGSRLNFGYGCAAHSFEIEPLARLIFVKMIPLARLISPSKVPRGGVFLTKLAKVSHSLDKNLENYVLKVLPNFDISLTKIAKRQALALTNLD